MVLSKVQTPNDLKNLSFQEMNLLADEIREFLIQSISETGGHLSSNLGAVELTIALHYCFDFSSDKIIWDVGHQSYTHKILTGRKNMFDSLRKKDGLSGFIKTDESIYDHFNAGHSSTSISAAIGFAAARDLQHKDYNVVSVIGDGSITGGLVYEALNNAGAHKKKMIIVLNDNQMSIDENVGSISTYLNQLRVAPKYLEAKIDIKNFIKKFGFGDNVNKFLEKAKEGLKSTLVPNVFFEELGIKYIGPIDGHNIPILVKTLNNIKNIDEPVLLHVLTKKGSGYKYAEEAPYNYHGVTPFNTETGKSENVEKEETYSKVFGKYMVRQASKDKNLVAITAAMPSGTGLSFFSKVFPDRFFDVGIAEEHATIFAGGLAMAGVTPVFAVYSTFLQRAYDQIIHDIAIQNLHVVFCIDRAGVVGNDGETHQGIFDLSYLSHIPNLTVMAPKNKSEFISMLDFAIYKHKAPIAIRYPRGVAKNIYSKGEPPIEYGKAEIVKKGEKIAIISVGTMIESAKIAYQLLKRDGLKPCIINIRFVSPIDKTLLAMIKKDFTYIFTIEDNILSGGFGESFTNFLLQNEVFNKKVYNIAFPKQFIHQASVSELYEEFGLTGKAIYEKIKKKVRIDKNA